MGYTVNKSLRFECDYGDILAYLVDDLKSPRSALALINERDRVIDFLETTPFANSVSTKPTLAKNEYREMTVKSYVVVYRVQESIVHLVRMFHQTQRYERFVMEWER